MFQKCGIKVWSWTKVLGDTSALYCLLREPSINPQNHNPSSLVAAAVAVAVVFAIAVAAAGLGSLVPVV